MVRKKNRRKITCGGRNYVWYVLGGDGDYWDNNRETPFLHIISEDKTLVLAIPLDAPIPYAVSEGRLFQGKPKSGCWERYLLPFKLPEAITPKVAADIINWAENGEGAVKVEYGGEFRY